MNEASFPEEVRTALTQSWNPHAAAASMDRWLTVCDREGWGAVPENLSLLTLLFGASWYFTRLVFFCGRDVIRFMDDPAAADFSLDILYRDLTSHDQKADLEQRFDLLRLAKNELMLKIFLFYLQEKLNQEEMERALTCLAEATLQRSMELLWEEKDRTVHDIAILAMGRMAGAEMNFGSDLDLIFLFSDKSGSDAGGLMRQIRTLLRHIAMPAPSGILYEIDMRLRPHGTSGTLISPMRYFIEYHSGEREIWERQMMTRCRPVVDHQALATQALATISPFIYASHEPEHLRTEILRMRKKVQDELGRPQGKYEIKRGSGGIMDIDFLTHYLQLLHGHACPALRTPSTRSALRQLNKTGFIDEHQMRDLLAAYDFLKRLECVLRVADLKNINTFSSDVHDAANQRLGRAMGLPDTGKKSAAAGFIHEYLRVTRSVRGHFTTLVGDIERAGTRD